MVSLSYSSTSLEVEVEEVILILLAKHLVEEVVNCHPLTSLEEEVVEVCLLLQ